MAAAISWSQYRDNGGVRRFFVIANDVCTESLDRLRDVSFVSFATNSDCFHFNSTSIDSNSWRASCFGNQRSKFASVTARDKRPKDPDRRLFERYRIVRFVVQRIHAEIHGGIFPGIYLYK